MQGSCSDFNPGQSSEFSLRQLSFFICKVVPIICETIPCQSLWAKLVEDHRLPEHWHCLGLWLKIQMLGSAPDLLTLNLQGY